MPVVQANWLKANGVQKGDAVAIYLPMLPELPIAMLACARIGAVHSVIFGGFSSDALASRVKNCEAKVVITATGGMRGKKAIPLKGIVDKGLAKVSGVVSHVIDSMCMLRQSSCLKKSVPTVVFVRLSVLH